MRDQNDSIMAFVEAGGDAAHRRQQAGSFPRSVNAPAPNCTPRSEWITAPDGGVQESIAMPSALVTSSAVGEASIDYPTTRRK
jgi:hypothetical protein